MSIFLDDAEVIKLKDECYTADRYAECFHFDKFARAIQLALIEKMRNEPVGYRWKGSDEPDSKWRLCRGPEQVKNLDLPGTKIELLHTLPTPQELENE